MKKFWIALFVICIGVSQTWAQKKSVQTFIMPKSALYSKGNVLVRMKPAYKDLFEGSSSAGRAEGIIAGVNASPLVSKTQLQKNNKARTMPTKIDMAAYYQLTFDPNRSVENFINELYSTGYFELVEPNYIYKSHVVPNDPQIGNQYHLQKIKAYEAWDIAKGSNNTAVVIAIIDTGGDLLHADLKDNLFTNPNEIAGNGIDDDQNGFTDDVQGWDFIGADTANWAGDNNVQVTKGGDISHGTWTSGCASATTNNGTGISGVAYNTKLLFTKHSGDNQKTTSGSVYNAYSGLLYAANLGIKIINCSFGGSGRSQIVQDVINYIVEDLGCLIVASAGNDGSSEINYPAGYDNVISVAATDSNDKVASFSNYGSTIDISAPGVNILTTGYSSVLTNGSSNTYNTESGTSFSSPIVAGAAALVWAKFPTYTPQQVAEQLRVTADATALYAANPAKTNLLGKGRLDVNRALTISTPSVRASNLNLTNTKGYSVRAGEKGFLTLNLTNYLLATNNLKVTLSTTSNFVSISNTSINPGVIGTNSIYPTTKTPFELTLSELTPENTPVDFTITYDDGANYSDYQFVSFLVNRSFLDVNKNNISTTVSGIGRIGFEDTSNSANGNGFIYANNSILYEMGLIMGTSSSNIFNNVRGANNNFDQDFVTIDKIRERTQGKKSYNEVYGSFSNSQSASQQKIAVSYSSMVWQQEPYSNFVIMEYKVKNPTTTAINGFHFGVFADWDISNSGANDAAGYDATTHLGYVYPVKSSNLPLGGIQSLTGTAEYYAIDNLDTNAGSSSFGLYNTTTGSFTDVEKFTSISSGLGRLQAGVGNASGNDVSHVISSGPYDIAAGQEITIAFALHAATNLNNLKTSAIYADSVYNKILAATLNSSTCYGNPATLVSGNDKTNWYQYPTGGEVLSTAKQFTTGNLKADTILYTSSSGQNTARIPVVVSLKSNPTIIAAGSTTFCDGQSVTLSVASADTYLWSNGETTQSIQVKKAGNYAVTVTTNSPVCTAASTPVPVSILPLPTAKFTNSTPVVLFTPVTFTDQSTNAISWLWDFGDGATSSLKNPSHSYQSISTPNVKLTVTASNNCIHSSTSLISVITGLEDDDHLLGMYPNPVISSQLKIEVPASLEASVLSILNTTGQVIYSRELTVGMDNLSLEVPIQNFPDGMYFVQVKTKGSLVTKKIIKVN